jgi:peroxiredoxin
MRNRDSRQRSAVRAATAAAVLYAAFGSFLASEAIAQTGATPTAEKPHEDEIGALAPDFTLSDTDGNDHTLSAYTKDGLIVVIEWFNPDCPFIKKHHLSHKTMNELRAEYLEKGVVWLAINSSAPGKQGHGLERNRRARVEYEMAYPILIDESGAVGRLYGAKTTPHMYIVGTDGKLLYEGAIDDNRDVATLGEVNYVAEALAAITAGKPVAESETRPYGCSVKYAN